jgi:hypothetical protein
MESEHVIAICNSNLQNLTGPHPFKKMAAIHEYVVKKLLMYVNYNSMLVFTTFE